jgi:hypothetical protein
MKMSYATKNALRSVYGAMQKNEDGDYTDGERFLLTLDATEYADFVKDLKKWGII